MADVMYDVHRDGNNFVVSGKIAESQEHAKKLVNTIIKDKIELPKFRIPSEPTLEVDGATIKFTFYYNLDFYFVF